MALIQVFARAVDPDPLWRFADGDALADALDAVTVTGGPGRGAERGPRAWDDRRGDGRLGTAGRVRFR